MKFTRILGLMVLLGFCAVVTHADGGVDPTVKVNKFPDPTCPPSDSSYTCFSVNDQADPLFIPVEGAVGAPMNYVWDGAGALTALFVEFTYTPGFIYTCQSNVFATCGTVAPSVNPKTDLEFEFVNGSIAPCTISGDCTGVSAGVAPEPNSALLLFAGLGCLFFFARKRLVKQNAGAQNILSV